MARYPASAVMAVMMLLPAGVAEAQLRDPGSHARIDPASGFGILLDANYLSPRGCDEVVDSGPGAPHGVRIAPGAVAYTIVVETRLRDCGRRGPKVVRALRPINAPLPGDLHLFFVSTGGHVLKRELVVIQP